MIISPECRHSYSFDPASYKKNIFITVKWIRLSKFKKRESWFVNTFFHRWLMHNHWLQNFRIIYNISASFQNIIQIIPKFVLVVEDKCDSYQISIVWVIYNDIKFWSKNFCKVVGPEVLHWTSITTNQELFTDCWRPLKTHEKAR